jgi:hypothetical protein
MKEDLHYWCYKNGSDYKGAQLTIIYQYIKQPKWHNKYNSQKYKLQKNINANKPITSKKN